MANELAKKSIKRYEGLRLKAYLCPAGKWTIGYGQTYGIRPGMVWTEAQAEADLDIACINLRLQILKYVRPDTTEQQLQAFISLVYNIGITNFKTSTILRWHNAYAKKDDMDKAFLMWIKATVDGRKVTLRGLVTRRWSEAQIYSSGELL